MGTAILVIVNIIVLVYLVIKQRQIYLLKKYPPGSGKKLIIGNPYPRKYYPNEPNAYKFVRFIRAWEENKKINEDGKYESAKYVEYEVWEPIVE